MLGVYVHLPFCPYLCPYCDFAKWPMRAANARRYLDALYAEIADAPSARAETLFLGGGTPELRTMPRRLPISSADCANASERLSEASIEVNPELAGEGDFERYREAGITRLSIGVQSFEPAEIQTLGRQHTPEQVGRVVSLARAAGFDSISLDLMFAVPGQTLGELAPLAPRGNRAGRRSRFDLRT